ncbi:hypothetical protein ACT8ZS_32405 [Paenibacillus sp. M.A.Huq-84]
MAPNMGILQLVMKTITASLPTDGREFCAVMTKRNIPNLKEMTLLL